LKCSSDFLQGTAQHSRAAMAKAIDGGNVETV
jgi:hypothetical protein